MDSTNTKQCTNITHNINITCDIIYKTCESNFLLDIVNKDKKYNYQKVKDDLHSIFNIESVCNDEKNEVHNNDKVDLYDMKQYMNLFEDLSDFLTHKQTPN